MTQHYRKLLLGFGLLLFGGYCHVEASPLIDALRSLKKSSGKLAVVTSNDEWATSGKAGASAKKIQNLVAAVQFDDLITENDAIYDLLNGEYKNASDAFKKILIKTKEALKQKWYADKKIRDKEELLRFSQGILDSQQSKLDAKKREVDAQ